MTYRGLHSASQAEATPLLGILYAEDFDDAPVEAERAPPPEPTPAEPAPLTQTDLDRACVEAVETARAEWEAKQRQQRTHALAEIASAMGAARQDADREAAAIAEGTVTTMLSMLAGALPRYCRTHGPAEVRTLMQHLLPNLRREPRVVIRVHPALAPILQQDLALLDEELAEAVTITPAALELGDVRVNWTDGFFVRDTAKILAAMQEALAQLGLVEPINPATERRMALAE